MANVFGVNNTVTSIFFEFKDGYVAIHHKNGLVENFELKQFYDDVYQHFKGAKK